MRKLMRRGGKIGEIVGRGDDISGDVDVEGGHEQGNHGKNDGPRITKPGQNLDRVPNCLAKDDHRGGSHGDADERIKRHGGR